MKKRRKHLGFKYLVLFGIFLIVSSPRIGSLIRHRRTLNFYLSEVKRMEKENEKLKDYLEHLKNDPFYVEKILREKYSYMQPGEVGIIFEEGEQTSVPH